MIIFRDDFDGGAGSPPDASKWSYDLGAGGWGNAELESYTADRQNSQLDGKGNLLIIPVRSAAGSWSSARLVSNPILAPASGILRIEAQLRLPVGKNLAGYWPAFWALGVGSWPHAGEIDIMENIDGEHNVYSSFHCDGFNFSKAFYLKYRSESHVFAAELDKTLSEIRYYVGTRLVATLPASQVGGGWDAATQEYNLILNVAIGGSWPKDPTADTSSGCAMSVAYVTAYTK